MQTPLSVWHYGGNESLTHKLLKSACLLYLEAGSVEKSFENGIADVLHGGTVIECLSRPTQPLVLDKLKKYRSRRLIFAVPRDTPPKIFEGLGTTVWFVDLPSGTIIENKFKESPEYLLGMFMELVGDAIEDRVTAGDGGETRLALRVRKFGRGHWIYIPKNVMELLDMPDEFDANVEGSKLILTPKTK